MEFKQLKIKVENSIAIVINNRPDKLNALNNTFFEELNIFLDNLSPQIKVIIFTGEGKAFVAGADISEMKGKTQQQAEDFSKYGQQTLNRLENLEIPVIAAVNGFALGGGCELAMACDIRIASPLAKFGQPEVNLGIIPGYAGTQRLSRLIGLGNALHLIMTSEIIDAQEAYRIGLVQKITEPNNLIETAIQVASQILEKAPNAIKKAKKVIVDGSKTNFENGCNLEAVEFGNLFNSDAIEGLNAFMDKRKPDWK